MASDIKVIIEAILNDKKFQQGISRIKTGAQQQTGLLTKLKGSWLGITAAVTAVGFAFVKFFKVGVRFEKSIKKVVSITGTGEKALAKLARTAGKNTVFSASEAADALFFLASAGLQVKDMADVLEPALNLASAGQLGIAEATDAVVNNLKVFNADMSEAADFTDIMATASKNANTDMAQLVEALRSAGPIAATTGASFEDLNVLIAAMADRGFKGSRAGIQLRQAFARLIKPTSQAKDALAKYGITTQEITKLLPTPIALFKRLNEVGLSNADALAILGVRQSGIFSIIKDGIPTLDKLTEKMKDYSGASKEMADIQIKTVAGALKLLKSKWEELILVLSGEALPGLQKFILFISNAVGNLAEIIDETGKYGTRLTKVDEEMLRVTKGQGEFNDQVAESSKFIRDEILQLDNLKNQLEILQATRRKEAKGKPFFAISEKNAKFLDAILKVMGQIEKLDDQIVADLKEMGFQNIKTAEQFKKAYDAIQEEIAETGAATDEANKKQTEGAQKTTEELAAEAAARAELIKEINEIFKEEVKLSEEEEQQRRLARIDELLEKVKSGTEEEIKLHKSKTAIVEKIEAEAAKKKKKQADNLVKIDKARREESIMATKSALSNIASLTSSNNKTLFAIGKATASAKAAMNVAEAVTKTMAGIPYPLNIPLAIAQGLAGAVQIAKIQSQTLPAFREGVTNFKGGMALVGEGGPEIARFPSGTDIIPNREIPSELNKTVNNDNRIFNEDNRSFAFNNEELPGVGMEEFLEISEMTTSRPNRR